MTEKRTVLIVDDSKMNRLILNNILETDYKVLQAENGLEAYHLLIEEPERVSAILLDLVMPIMDGYELLNRLKKHTRLKNIPVIIMTQRDGDEDEILALSRGAADFLGKPYNPLIIKHRLANIIQLRETAALINLVESDSLTKLYNKEGFHQRVKDLFRQHPNSDYDIVVLNVVKFKLINDIFGVETGDKILRFLGDFLWDIAARMKGFAARISADNFAIILPRQQDYESLLITGFVEAARPYIKKYGLSVRFGIYEITDANIGISIMCDRAKLAADSIKNSYSKMMAVYDEQFRNELLREQQITSLADQALREHQFVVYYQPKCSLADGTITGAEALVRWQHPTLGFIPPGDFIPVFERSSFIVKLDLYVFEQVCQTLRYWIDNSMPIVPVSVNLSRVDLFQPRLIETLKASLKKYDLSSNLINLEITESAYTDNAEKLIQVVRGLQNSGFSIEMDDFGTGYSSLNMLNELPIDILKLDMRFLQGDKTLRDDKNVLAFVISLANLMGFTVVAEGVETEGQVRYLYSMDCQLGQGYYFSRPVPAAEFEALLRDSHAIGSPIIHSVNPSIVALKELFDPNSQFSRLFNNNQLPCALLSTNLEHETQEIIRLNRAMCTKFDISTQHMHKTHSNILDYIVKEDQDIYYDTLKKLDESVNGSATCRFYASGFPGKDSVWDIKINVVRIYKDEERVIYYCRSEKAEKLNYIEAGRYHLPMFDYDTGLLTNEAFRQRAQEKLQHNDAKILGLHVIEYKQPEKSLDILPLSEALKQSCSSEALITKIKDSAYLLIENYDSHAPHPVSEDKRLKKFSNGPIQSTFHIVKKSTYSPYVCNVRSVFFKNENQDYDTLLGQIDREEIQE